MDPRVRVVTTTEETAALARALAGATAGPIGGRGRGAPDTIALDLESDGIFAYKARLCTLQLAAGSGDAQTIAIVDTLAADVAPLASLVGPSGPVKIVHDVSFDSRMLAEAGLVLGNVHDTSIAARMLGRQATGLATLLEAELQVLVSKELQHHDWRIRPLDDRHVFYLASDVAHLSRLHDALWSEVTARGIEAEVLCETDYRIASAVAAARTPDPREPYERLKGIERVRGVELAVARRLAEVREREAERRDVPPHRVLPAEALLAVARSRPATAAQLRKMRVPLGTKEADAFAEALLAAVRQGMADGEPPARPKAPRDRAALEASKERRAREGKLTAWRREQAKLRGMDEQAVLPGHCVKDVAALEGAVDAAALATVPGIGAFRVARDGEAILRALAAPGGDEAEART